jgi:hypothetical protein
MKKLVLLLIVLAICLPSFGQIFVYKVTTKAKGAGSEDGSTPWTFEGGTARAYLIVEADGEEILNAMFIPYGKNYDGEKVYVEDSVINPDGFGLTIYGGDKHDVWGIDMLSTTVDDTVTSAISNAVAEIDNLDVQYGRVVGKTSKTRYGPTSDYTGEIAKSLKGCVILSSVDPQEGAPEFFGTAQVKAALNSKFTKNANDPDVGDGDFEAAVIAVEDYLYGKHYTGVSQDPS